MVTLFCSHRNRSVGGLGPLLGYGTQTRFGESILGNIRRVRRKGKLKVHDLTSQEATVPGTFNPWILILLRGLLADIVKKLCGCG